RGAAAPLALPRGLRAQPLDDLAAREGDAVHLAVAPDGDLETLRQRVRHRHAHAVQAARETVGAAVRLVELAAGVQPREHDLDDRNALLRMLAHRDATAVEIGR